MDRLSDERILEIAEKYFPDRNDYSPTFTEQHSFIDFARAIESERPEAIPAPVVSDGWMAIENPPQENGLYDLWVQCTLRNDGLRIPDCTLDILKEGNYWAHRDEYLDEELRSRYSKITHWRSRPKPPATAKTNEAGSTSDAAGVTHG